MNRLAPLAPAVGVLTALLCFAPAAVQKPGPYLQITGHYAQHRTELAGVVVTIGKGPANDLRMTEAEIDREHGTLAVRGNRITYEHRSATHPTEVIRNGMFPGDHWTAFQRLQDGDILHVSGPTQRSLTVDLVDGEMIELWTANGERRRTLLAAREGSSVPLRSGGGVVGWLVRCPSGIAFARSNRCDSATVEFGLAGNALFALHMPLQIPSNAPVPQWLRNGRIRKGKTIPNAFLNDGAGDELRFIPDANGVVSVPADAKYVVYRTAGKEKKPRIARVGTATIALTRSGKTQNVGQTEIGDGDTLLLGTTHFALRRQTSSDEVIELTAIEKYDRFHFFYSLSAGRINFANRLRLLDLDSQQLIVEGTTGIAPLSLSDAPASTADSEHVLRLPLPRFLAGTDLIAAKKIARLRLAGVPSQPQLDVVALRDPTLPPGLQAATTLVGNGKQVRLGGHLIDFHQQVPLYEQTAVPWMAGLFLASLGWIAAAGLWDATRATSNDFRPLLRIFVLFALAAIWFLLTVGILLMNRMASVDTLIGKPDYYHRQLFYSFVTAAFIAASVRGVTAKTKGLGTVGWIGFPLSLPTLFYAAILLVAWQILDAATFLVVTGNVFLPAAILTQIFTGCALLLLFAGGGIAAIDETKSSHVPTIIASVVGTLLVAGAVYFAIKSAHTAAILCSMIFVAWGAVLSLRKMPPRRIAARGAAAQPPGRLEMTRRTAHNALLDLRDRWSETSPDHRLPLYVGLIILAAGIWMGSERGGIGFKPAEFAVWFIAPGLCAMLASQFERTSSDAHPRPGVLGFLTFHWRLLLALVLTMLVLPIVTAYGGVVSPALVGLTLLPPAAAGAIGFWLHVRAQPSGNPGSTIKTLRTYEPVLLAILGIEGVLVGLYAKQGDFGPLLVLLPSVVFVTAIWALSPEASPDEKIPSPSAAGRYRRLTRYGMAAVFFTTLLWALVVGRTFVREWWAAESSTSISRAAKRLVTATDPWFTKEGSWSTQSLWLANGYYEEEHMLANLHSDLAVVALLQSFGLVRSLMVIAAYLVLAWFCIAALALQTSRWAALATPPGRVFARRAMLILYFSAFYLLFELYIHVGSALNAIPQTGVTLPWVSSGGSAALGFGGICAIALTTALGARPHRERVRSS
ncbi:MAG: FtsW/RodA/SpoVE family cell cycle protein [Thermoanaerobaculia bacterium]